MLRSRLCTGFIFSLLLGVFLMPGCVDMMPDGGTDGDGMDDGPVAEGISGKLGDPLPNATDDQLASFERGKSVFNRVFDLEDGLGPAFNVTFCGACHERPTVGGSAGLYRNFVIAGRLTDDGAFLFSESAGDADGVLRKFAYSDDLPARPDIPSNATIFAQRNPIPFFGVGLLAELSDEEILRRVDPDDADGDGISGRANFDRGFVGRFGRKSQTVSIEGFIRGPLFNHLGITSDPLTEVQRALLPVDSSLDGLDGTGKLRPRLQAAAPDGPLTDDDAAPDPELSTDELFDLVSFSMLLAAPTLEEPTEQTNRGRLLFHDAGCVACHT
ncbi:MAG: di-heme oxidoredictase family protein, partial [Phycisphaerae bacterium]